jgi:hypothetical protein
MKRFRIFTAVLMLLLAATPAMAAFCAIQCADYGAPVPASMHGMEAMADCHDHAAAPDAGPDQADQADQNHSPCNMAGCHFSQQVPLASPFTQLPDGVAIAIPRLDSQAFSADLSPPLKPPA